MILIKSGKLTIPEEDRFIGHVGDNLHCVKQFLVENNTDENCIYRLYLTFDDGTVNYFVLDSKVENGSTTLTWTITDDHIFKNGMVKAQIKTFYDNEEIAHTTYDYFYVGNSAEFTQQFANKENSEFLQYEKKLNEIYQKILVSDLDDYVLKARTIAGVDLVDDITADELINALELDASGIQDKAGVYPVITDFLGDPTEATKGMVGQLYFDSSREKFFVCVDDVAPYGWRELVLSNQLKTAIKSYLEENSFKDGVDGKSAYEVALENGFEGTQKQWLESLKGTDGASASILVSENDYGYDLTVINTGEGASRELVSIKHGEDGSSASIEVTETDDGYDLTVINTGEGASRELVSIKHGKDGVDGADGKDGADGYTPIKGVDYFTESEKTEIIDELVDDTGLITSLSYNAVTNNLCDEVYEYGYLSSTGENNDNLTPITVSFRTKNYIKVEGGRTLCFNSPYGTSTTMQLCQYNANYECIVERTGVMTEIHKWSDNSITLDENTRYVRFTIYNEISDLSTVKLNLFYYENRDEMWAGAGDEFLYVPSRISEHIGDFIPKEKVQSALTGKKIVYDGDSICFGGDANGGYSKIIAEVTGSKYENFAQGGARLTTKPDGETYHSVVDNLTELPADGDLYCFEGGINDYWTEKQLGTFSKTDFTGELDKNTVCGALETIFRYALNTFVGKPVCFIITHKIQNTAYAENSNGDTFEDYRNAMVGICEKYSIPYYDAFTKSGLNGWNTAQNNAYLTANSEGTADGCHPNTEGYKRYYVPQLISLFESIMPADYTDATSD